MQRPIGVPGRPGVLNQLEKPLLQVEILATADANEPISLSGVRDLVSTAPKSVMPMHFQN